MTRKWWILGAMAGILGLVVLDETVVGVALVTIRGDLGMSDLASHWVVNAYLLSFTCCVAVGGRLGDGSQQFSWIAIDDVVRALVHLLTTPSLSGPFNLTAPNPVTNLQFTKTLGRALRRPTVLPMPAAAMAARADGSSGPRNSCRLGII